MSTKILLIREAIPLPEQKSTCVFIVMVRFHTLLQCRRTVHAIQGFQVNRGGSTLFVCRYNMQYIKQSEKENDKSGVGSRMPE